MHSHSPSTVNLHVTWVGRHDSGARARTFDRVILHATIPATESLYHAADLADEPAPEMPKGVAMVVSAMQAHDMGGRPCVRPSLWSRLSSNCTNNITALFASDCQFPILGKVNGPAGMALRYQMRLSYPDSRSRKPAERPPCNAIRNICDSPFPASTSAASEPLLSLSRSTNTHTPRCVSLSSAPTTHFITFSFSLIMSTPGHADLRLFITVIRHPCVHHRLALVSTIHKLGCSAKGETHPSSALPNRARADHK